MAQTVRVRGTSTLLLPKALGKVSLLSIPSIFLLSTMILVIALPLGSGLIDGLQIALFVSYFLGSSTFPLSMMQSCQISFFFLIGISTLGVISVIRKLSNSPHFLTFFQNITLYPPSPTNLSVPFFYGLFSSPRSLPVYLIPATPSLSMPLPSGFLWLPKVEGILWIIAWCCAPHKIVSNVFTPILFCRLSCVFSVPPIRNPTITCSFIVLFPGPFGVNFFI